MLPWILIGGIALFGFFALKDDNAGAAPLPPGPFPGPGSGPAPVPGFQPAVYTPGTPAVIAPSGYPAIDAELHASADALVASYHAHQGCMGLDTLSVRRFQEAFNTSITVRGPFPAPLHADGVFDEETSVALGVVTGQTLSECMLTFEQISAAAVPSAFAMTQYGTVQQQTAPAPTPYTPSSHLRRL